MCGENMVGEIEAAVLVVIVELLFFVVFDFGLGVVLPLGLGMAR